MDKIKKQGITMNDFNPLDEPPAFETEYSYEQIIELLGDKSDEKHK